MAMTEGYRNAVADHGGSLITHIGLVDETGTELTGGSPAYARKAVTWVGAAAGIIRPTGNLTFDVPAGVTVGGWPAQGQYTLLAAVTGIRHEDPA